MKKFNFKFYFQSKDGLTYRELSEDEVREHLSAYQIAEALEAKRNDPDEEVAYMTVGGYIVLDV